MKTNSFIRNALITLCLGTGFSASADTTGAPVTFNVSDEAYLGAITYTGGLMERGRLELPNVEDIRYVRVHVPSFCQAEVFEAGTTTEGIDDLADRTMVPSVYAVNQGRGNHVRGVFISLNGPQDQNCSILIFRKNTLDSGPTDPDSRPLQATTCIENSLPFPVAAQLRAGGVIQNVTLPPRQVMILQHVLRTGEPLPALSIKFDRDLSPNVFWATYDLANAPSRDFNCLNSPVYRFFSPSFNLVDLMRLR